MPEDIPETKGAQMLGIGLPLYPERAAKDFRDQCEASEFPTASEANFIPNDRFRRYFPPTLVNAGGELVLFDTG